MSDQHPTPDPTDPEPFDHVYDGIREYDNPTPGWWNWMFIGCMIFAPLYIIWFHSPISGNTLLEQYDRNVAANLKLQFGDIILTPDQATLVKYMDDDEEWRTIGQVTFMARCADCHGKDAQGISAPNLTDEKYLHVKNIEDIAKIVSNGVDNTAMSSWKSRLHVNELVLVAAYVASLRGKNAESTRKAEGNEIAPWPTEADLAAEAKPAEETKPDEPATDTP